MKIAYFGTADFSRDIFLGLQTFPDIDIVLTVSQPDTPVGRKQTIVPTSLKQASGEANIECLQPEKIKNNPEFVQYLKDLQLDYIVVVAYGKILPKEILEIAKFGTINIHTSLLPKYRGASPIQEALKLGEKETGLTIMLMSEGMDEGDILVQAKIEVDIVDNSQTLFDKFAKIGPKLLHETLREYSLGNIVPQKQQEAEVSYCKKIQKEDGNISFQTMTAREIHQRFQAYFIWPGIYNFLSDGKRLVVEDCFYSDEKRNEIPGTFIQISKHEFGIVCKEGVFLLKQVKPEGKKSMDTQSFVNGNREILNYNFI